KKTINFFHSYKHSIMKLTSIDNFVGGFIYGIVYSEDYVRCVLPDLALPLGKNGDYLVNHFKDKYDINIEYLEQTSTKSGKGPKSSRIDQIFNVKNDSLDKFKQIKDKIGALYVTEIVKNNEHHLYKERIYLKYFK